MTPAGRMCSHRRRRLVTLEDKAAQPEGFASEEEVSWPELVAPEEDAGRPEVAWS